MALITALIYQLQCSKGKKIGCWQNSTNLVKFLIHRLYTYTDNWLVLSPRAELGGLLAVWAWGIEVEIRLSSNFIWVQQWGSKSTVMPY